MKRTSLLLPDDVDSRIRREARRRGVPLAILLREAIENYVPAQERPGELSIFGIGESGRSDVSRNVDAYVRDAVIDNYEKSRR